MKCLSACYSIATALSNSVEATPYWNLRAPSSIRISVFGRILNVNDTVQRVWDLGCLRVGFCVLMVFDELDVCDDRPFGTSVGQVAYICNVCVRVRYSE
ncbi:hypothetical protein DFJ77DRAFT_84581 [Powellomyces hirtus]|nr:hypothetical protein DFJ77DRAFT_84581 [Powellomyces hirtus]